MTSKFAGKLKLADQGTLFDTEEFLVKPDGKVAEIESAVIAKFVSLPTKLLIGENTYHAYLLQAEYGNQIFPQSTLAIGSIRIINDEITGIVFDFGDEHGKQHAVRQVGEWAEDMDYLFSPLPMV